MIENVDTEELRNYKKLKNAYKLFCVGCVIFLTGFLFIFFGRPYTFDRTNKDLFFVFGLVFMIPGSCIALFSANLLFRLWKNSNDFVKLNKTRLYPEDAVQEPVTPEKQWVMPPENSINFSKFGLDLNEPI